jgi:hypothetical protein
MDDKPAFHPEDDQLEKGHSARRTDVAPHPSSGGRISLEKTTGEA